jgi:Cu(I)/Ag(I) efflux system membrane fusion protein
MSEDTKRDQEKFDQDEPKGSTDDEETAQDQSDAEPEPEPEPQREDSRSLELRGVNLRAVNLRAVNWGGLVIMLVFGLIFGALFFGGDSGGGGGGDDEHAGHEHAEAGEEDGDVTWTCSMHPQIQQDEPGQCPICGMDLIPASSGESGPAIEPDQIRLNERARKLARIRTSEVRRQSAEGVTRRLLGQVQPAETRVKTVTAWTSGRIDRLRVATTGQKVRRGQVIADIYSPEIYAAHRELLAARQQVAKLKGSAEYVQKSATRTLAAAQRKLDLLGVSDAQLEKMTQADEPWDSVAIRTQFGGTVLERLVDEGNYVQAGTGIYRIADLSKLWVQLDAYESDLPNLAIGQPVEVTLASLPGEVFEGEIAFIDPVVNTRTRTVQVRVEVDNSDGRLRPGMWAKSTIFTTEETSDTADAPLVIPETAPLFAGQRSLVYIELPDKESPTYEAREVVLGAKVGGVFPVISGLREGEQVVTQGAFIIDADLQIRGGKSLMTRPDDTAMQPVDQTVMVSNSFRERLAPLFRTYLDAQRALASDQIDAAKAAAGSMQKALEVFEPGGKRQAARVWDEQRPKLAERVLEFGSAESLDEARRALEPLTESMKGLLTRFGNPLDKPIRVASCPMAFGDRSAEWLQTSEEVDNAYRGAEMRRCGQVHETIDQGAHLNVRSQ